MAHKNIQLYTISMRLSGDWGEASKVACLCVCTARSDLFLSTNYKLVTACYVWSSSIKTIWLVWVFVCVHFACRIDDDDDHIGTSQPIRKDDEMKEGGEVKKN